MRLCLWFVFLTKYPANANDRNTASKNKQAKITEKSASKTEPAKRFNFYDILPDTIVTTPKVEEYRFREKNGSDDFYYTIQTGSFKNRQDAERQKATIDFQGLKAKIETITSNKGTIWHRVKTGPYTNRSKLNSALDKLVSINIQPLVKKVKKDN